jgi:hypothetical protein
MRRSVDLRGQMQVLPLPDFSEQIVADLDTLLAKQDPRLRLRGFTVKGDIDLEWDVLAAETRLARGTADSARAARRGLREPRQR